jgi:hypothetical protein
MIAVKNSSSQLVAANLSLSRFASLCTDCGGIGPTMGGVGVCSNLSYTNTYNALVASLVNLGFAASDADQIANAACLTWVAGLSLATVPPTATLEQWCSAAGLATAIGLLVIPGDCSSSCNYSPISALAAALANTPISGQPAAAMQMWTAMMNLGVIA